MPSLLPLSRATTLIPFLRFLDERHAPVDQTLEQEYLPPSIREKPECYVATRLNWHFVDRMARQENIEDLGLQVGHRAGVSIFGKRLHTRLERAPTLADALHEYCEHVKLESTGMRCWVTIDDEEARLCLRETFGPATSGYGQHEWLGLMSMVTVAQLFSGPTWEPRSISLRQAGPLPKLAHELFPNTVLLAAQPHAFVSFPVDMLYLPRCAETRSPRFAVPSASELERFEEAPEHGLLGALTQSLEPYLSDGCPDVALGAKIADMSVRTLKRHLHDHDVTYSDVVDEARFRVASRLLRGTEKSIAETSRDVGYSHPWHFTRGFRRLTGMSPLEFRRKAGRAQA